MIADPYFTLSSDKSAHSSLVDQVRVRSNTPVENHTGALMDGANKIVERSYFEGEPLFEPLLDREVLIGVTSRVPNFFEE